jgi:hypothetical protein
MYRYSIRIAGLLLIVALAALVISQRKLIVKLRERVQFQSERGEQFTALVAENARLTMLAARNAHAEARPTDPTEELLRLRGEVTLLRREQVNADELRREIETLSQQNRVLRGPTANEKYFFDGLDTNSLPEIELGVSREKVYAELHRVGAKILSEGDNSVWVQTFPAVIGSSNGSLAQIKMQLYFNEGKLIMRIDSSSVPQ